MSQKLLLVTTAVLTLILSAGASGALSTTPNGLSVVIDGRAVPAEYVTGKFAGFT